MNIQKYANKVELVLSRNSILFFSLRVPSLDKDKQQEAERGLRYLTLFSGYCKHINTLYEKKDKLSVCVLKVPLERRVSQICDLMKY